MANDVSDPEGPRISVPQEAPRRRGSRTWLVVAGVAVLLLVVGLCVAASMEEISNVPTFPSLSAQPDHSLEGTVAYLDWAYPACVRVVAAAGAPAKTLGCGGSYLEWLEDGRLEVLAYDQPEGPETLVPTGGRIIDVATGAEEEVPLAEIPPEIPEASDPAIGPNGERVTVTGQDGGVEILLEDGSGTRKLLSVEGGNEYTMSMQGWSPDGEWILLADSAGRLLLVTVDEPSETWVLAEEYGDRVVITGDDAFAA
jgi:hypothetical protein